MVAAKHDITIEQGATFRKEIIYRDDDENPIDLTGAVARAMLRPCHGSATVKEFDVTIDGDPTLGTLIWEMSAEDTASIVEPYRQVYDVEIEFPDGTVVRLLRGFATILPEVTV